MSLVVWTNDTKLATLFVYCKKIGSCRQTDLFKEAKVLNYANLD